MKISFQTHANILDCIKKSHFVSKSLKKIRKSFKKIWKSFQTIKIYPYMKNCFEIQVNILDSLEKCNLLWNSFQKSRKVSKYSGKLSIVNIQPTLVQWAVRKGGALPTVTALRAQGMTILRQFFVYVLVQHMETMNTA